MMAGIFAKLPMIDTKLIIFDTEIVDLSGYVEDPVEVLIGMLFAVLLGNAIDGN